MKRMFFGMLVAIVAIGGSVATYASSLKSGSNKLVPAWYSFTGDDPESPSSYTRSEDEPTGCNGGENVCSILAEPDANNSAIPNLQIVSETNYKVNP